MSIRGDITVDWNLSPRIIEIAAPSTEVVLQDLVDTLRGIEAFPTNLQYPHLVDAAGKEELGGGVKVGITLTLKNAKVKFADRAGPDFIQCEISGGNLVALDENGDVMSSVGVSSYTQIVRTSSSSATLMELEAIQYSSYEGAVWIDVVNGIPGVEFPIGTPQQPVDNLTDAKTIAAERGFVRLHIVGNITIQSGQDISNFIVVGDNCLLTTVTLASGCVTDGTEFKDCRIEGVLNGLTRVDGCHVGDLLWVKGLICNSLIDGDITLAGDETVYLVRNNSGYPSSPDIDMGVSGRSLVIRGHSGDLTVRNFASPNDYVIADFESGKLELTSTVTAGTVIIRGIVELEDNAGDNVVIDITGMITTGSVVTGVDSNFADNMAQLLDLYRLSGLDPTRPLVVSSTERRAGPEIVQPISEDEQGVVTVTRQ